MEVVPLGNDEHVEANLRHIAAQSGSHVVVNVMGMSVTHRSWDHSGEGSSWGKQHARVNKGLHVKKGVGFQSPARAAVADWLSRAITMVDDEGQRMQHGLEHEYEVMGDPDADHLEVDGLAQHMSIGTGLVANVNGGVSL
ncbi:hypothetical protein V6N13_124748 [Hibiscus sabdariffa]|uniref:Uncharacterized protein n=1 Tax=Hibiscus sabdariffa TaxID=183260 RepID=A0ABR2U462_9ROSI